MTSGRQRQRRRILSISSISALVVLTLTALYSWGIGKLADTGTRAIDGSPLHVELSTPPEPGRAFSVIVPQPENALGNPVLDNSGSAIMGWASERGGAAADAISFTVTLYGKVDHPLILKGMRAKIVSREAPPTGTLFSPAGAGDLVQRPVSIDLDSTDLSAHPKSDGNGEWNFPLQVSTADAEQIFVDAYTVEADCRFVIEVDYTDNGTARTQTIDNKGEPFRVVASTAATGQASWDINGGQVTIATN